MNYRGCIAGCSPAQVINITEAVNGVPSVDIKDLCNESYNQDSIQYAYSLDGICWSCYGSYKDIMSIVADFESDYYLRAQVNGTVSSVTVDEEPVDYTTQIAEGFTLNSCETTTSSPNLYNPYANMEQAIALNQNLTEAVSCMTGIPIYYFKLTPDDSSRDLTFKEYTLMNVVAVKQIKLIIADNQMPSSKPEFSDWGFDFQTDWETEISKGSFATAFGINAQPQEGDLIYIPMMKRMWMVNQAYEEKKDAFMWNPTTFKVTLVKYQEKGSVNLGDTQAFVDSVVKNKYEDLFGTDENIDSSEAAADVPVYGANTYYPVFESDATRKYVTCKDTEIKSVSRHHKGTLVSDSFYDFTLVPASEESIIVYQHQYCGTDGTASFIIETKPINEEFTIFKAANIIVNIEQRMDASTIYVLNNESSKVTIENNVPYFVYIRWSKQMNNIEICAIKHSHPSAIPLYKLQPVHWYFDVDDADPVISKYNMEMEQYEKKDVLISKFYGNITNVKLFDIYIDNVSEIMQMYPTNQHLIINDTARKIIDLNGVSVL